ncbi:MAG: DegT/DnrJ/EryC1/StrS family aminotransferase [SAR324 cluster bacterium]|nr:DegT/DnrJ/EryC1/StrS family aminotransferase [SAR324 cluster bacterium]
MRESIPFIDLQAQRRRIKPEIDQAIARVLEHGRFIMGPEVAELETRLSEFCGARHTIVCASGTDALALALMAWETGPGHAVFVPAYTFVATAEVVAWCGATPVFVDVLEDTFNMDPASLEVAIAAAPEMGLTPKAVIPVDMFGLPANYPAILPLAEKHGLPVLADAAQSFGATLGGQRMGTFGQITATSFFPAKPLGCYGDGGAVFTGDDGLDHILRSLRVHGQGGDKYDNVRIGINGRLDTLQAAILLQKLTVFEDEIAARTRVAARYGEGLREVARIPDTVEGVMSTWAQYTLLIENRDRVAARLKEAGIPTAIYYPIPLNAQKGYMKYPSVPGGVPVSDNLATRAISLPMHPYLEAPVQDRIIEAVREAVQK